MKPQCLVLNDREPLPEDEVASLCPQFEFYWYQRQGSRFSLDEAFSSCPAAEILVTPPVPLSGHTLSRLANLRAIIATAVGYDYLDVSYCRLHSIHVFNTPGYAGPAVAEYAFALALAAARELREADHDARMSKHIPRSPAFEFYGRSAGIIGLGDIGCHVARIAKGFGMTVWFHNRTPRSSSFGVPVERERLLQTSDVIFITVPLNNDSRLLIGENELSLTKKGTILVSISPDDVIDMSALTRFLKDGRIFAALDLLQPHPELADCPNTVLSIRRAWYTKAAVERRLLTWTSTLAHLGSNTPINRVV